MQATRGEEGARLIAFSFLPFLYKENEKKILGP